MIEDIDDYFDVNESKYKEPYVFRYKRQDIEVISIRLGDVRDELVKLGKIPYELRDKDWRISFNIASSYERRMESALNEIIRDDFKPKLNY